MSSGHLIWGGGLAKIDPQLFSKALQHLILNALQAGAAHVEVNVSDGAVHVYDDGPGIPEELAAHVFRPFMTTKTRGTGLGLPNVARAVGVMGGGLSLCRSPLGGAGFAMRLQTIG